MKTFAGPVIKELRAAIPHGTEFPRGAAVGELFYLSQETKPHNTANPSYIRGAYFFDGVSWLKLNDTPRTRKATAIGAQELELEKLKPTFKVTNPPSFDDGFEVAAVSVQPSGTRATFSGTATMWVDTVEGTRKVWAVLWRAEERRKPVAIALTTVHHNEPTSLALTFFDMPNTDREQLYILKVYTDTVGIFLVNKGFSASFDSVGHTALIVEENT